MMLLPYIISPFFFFRTQIDEGNNSDIKSVLFEDPIARVCLKLYLKECLQEESILFWEEASKYRAQYNNKKSEENEKIAMNIYQDYIVDGSSREINISTSMKNKIKEEIKQNNVYI